ncbi:MAG: LysR family transcriptional regulator [Pseudomonadota bacterium]
MTSSSRKIGLSVRLDLPDGDRFGPGMANLLQRISDEGSIRSAATALGMSYPKALKLVDAMNGAFETPLIKARHGGKDHGGAKLTETGQRVLNLYHQLCDQAAADAGGALDTLETLLK